jgi:signal transduction histidine kinase/CheY-like chemotaxis protein
VQELAGLLEAVLHGVKDGVTVQDRSGRLVFANDVAARIIGFESAAAMLSVPGAELAARFEMFSESGQRVSLEALPGRVLLAGGAPPEQLLRFRVRGAQVDRWSRVRALPVRSAAGEPTHAVNLFRDVTAEREAAQRQSFLLRAANELSASLDWEKTLKTVAAIAVPDVADWCTVDMFGEGGKLERLAAAHVDPGKVALAVELIRRFPPDPKSDTGIFKMRRTGKPEWVRHVPREALAASISDPELRALLLPLELRSFICAPLKRRGETVGGITFVFAESGRLYDEGAVSFAMAVADRASVAIENARLYREAELGRRAMVEANRAKDEFLAVLGHELRNPLAPIATALDVMDLKDSETHARERAIIGRQVRHLGRLVDDLLDVSRITKGKVELSQQAISLADVVDRSVEMVSPLLEERAHRLEVTLERSLVVSADPSRLSQILANLLTNAAKYTDAGGEIAVRSERDGHAAVVRVRDNGMGISPQVLPHVFDLFVQEHQAIDRAQGGLGLGLAIARNLVVAHGGTISAHSEGVGKGSEFTLRLPLLQDEQAKALSTPPRSALGAGDRGTRVLLVDDNADALEMLAEALEELGYRVARAHDGPSALEDVARAPPDVAVLDLGLPVMDGYELARRLRGLPELEQVKLIALTGYGQSSDRGRTAEAGFDAHLVKPVKLEQVVDAIERLSPRRDRPSP